MENQERMLARFLQLYTSEKGCSLFISPDSGCSFNESPRR